MQKRIALLVAVALILSYAPAALATHCFRCRWDGEWTCYPAQGALGGWEFCSNDDGGFCEFSGNACEPHGGGLAPLAADFTVASVERLDEPQTLATEAVADETLVTTESITSSSLR